MKRESHAAIVALMSTALDIFDVLGIEVTERKGYPMKIRNKEHTYPSYDFTFTSKEYGNVTGTIHYDWTHFKVENSKLLNENHPGTGISVYSGKWNVHCTEDANVLYYDSMIFDRFKILLGEKYVNHAMTISLSDKAFQKRCRERLKMLKAL